MRTQQQDECYSSLLDSGQRANELGGWRSRDVFSVGPACVPMDRRDSEHVTYVFCAWSVPRSYLEDIRRYFAVERIRLES
jgi:hypothetical protein